MNLVTLNNTIKRWIYILKTDPEFMTKARILVLAFLVGLCLLFAGYDHFVTPKEKILKTKNHEYLSIKNSSASTVSDMLANSCLKMKKQDEELQAKVAVLQIKIKLLKEMQHGVADKKKFFQVLLSLLPSAPTSLDNGMIKLGQLPPLDGDNFKIFPVTIEGRASYDKLLEYIRYVESRPEVGMVDKLDVTVKNGKQSAPEGELFFSMQVGMIQVEESI